MTVGKTRGPGRPRSHGYDERIVDAAGELVERSEEITVARVLERSGVSRAAIAPHTIALDGDLLQNVLDAYTLARCREGIRVAWRGMAAEPA